MRQNYRSIKAALLEQIQNGTYRPNERLPAGDELCKMFSTSHMTIDRALRELVAEGYVVRRRRLGSYVAPHPDTGTVDFGREILLLIYKISPFSTLLDLFEGIEDVLLLRGYRLVVVKTDLTDGKGTLERLAANISEKTRGVIYLPGADEDNQAVYRLLREKNLPFIVAGHGCRETDNDISSVSSDHVGGMRTLVEHLLQQNYRRIGFFRIRGLNGDGMLLRNTWITTLQEHGVSFDETWEIVTENEDSIQATMRFVMMRENRPEVIIGLGDGRSLLLLSALHELGYQVPKDMALAGFGDAAFCQFCTPPMTTMKIKHREEGELLANGIADLAEGILTGPLRVQVPATLVIRTSCPYRRAK